MELKNITIDEYLQLEDPTQYDFFMRYSNKLNFGSDTMGVHDLMEHKFGLIKDLQYDIANGMTWNQKIEYVMKLTGKDYKTITSYKLTRFCPGWKYVLDQIDLITSIEMETLSYTPTNEEKQAGIDELDVLGVYLQIRKIAITLHYTIDQVKNMQYDEAFLELVTQKKLSDYEAELSRVYRSRTSV